MFITFPELYCEPIDHIRFMHDQGFRAIVDNGLMNREPAIQEKIANELDRLGMEQGPFVLYADFSIMSMVTRDPEIMDMLRNRMKEGLEVQKRTNVETALVVPGRYDQKLAWEYIAAFHVSDNPGRMEPTTGEINYLNIFKHIYSKGYDGVICMEHRRSLPGREGELALIKAYRQVDAF